MYNSLSAHEKLIKFLGELSTDYEALSKFLITEFLSDDNCYELLESEGFYDVYPEEEEDYFDEEHKEIVLDYSKAFVDTQTHEIELPENVRAMYATGCVGCIYEKSENICDKMNCCAHQRVDHDSVIFVKIESE